MQEETLKFTRDLATAIYNSGRYPEFHKVTERIYAEGGRYIDIANAEKTICSIQVTILRGMESNLPPIVALNNICYFNNRPCLWGDAALALVMAHPSFSGIHEEFKDGVATCALRRIMKPDRDIGDYTSEYQIFSKYTWQQAVDAGLSKLDHYKAYPERMLKMRARAWAMRDLFADVLNGLSIAEEQSDVDYMRKIGGAPDAGPAKAKDEESDPFTKKDLEDRGEVAPVDFNTMKAGATIDMGEPVYKNYTYEQGETETFISDAAKNDSMFDVKPKDVSDIKDTDIQKDKAKQKPATGKKKPAAKKKVKKVAVQPEAGIDGPEDPLGQGSEIDL